MIEPPALARSSSAPSAGSAGGRLDVDLDHLVEHVVGDVERRALADVGGAVVDQDVDRAELRLDVRRPGSRSDRACPRWQAIGTTLPGRAANSSAVAFEVLHLAAGDDDARAGLGQPLAIALPMPRPPPVTRATLPAKSIVRAIAFLRSEP